MNYVSSSSMTWENAKVKAVCKAASHTMRKDRAESITLLAGLGVQGDAHMGVFVKHRSRVAQNPHQPNLRQVHLIHSELHDELNTKGFEIMPGQMGENITTEGLDLLKLPKDTLLRIGPTAVVKVTGLRNPCTQLNGIQEGLMNAVLDRDEEGNLIRKAGIMSVVIAGGIVMPEDKILVELPDMPFVPLDRV